ncbi:hypothetical protein J6E39_03930 [bacterium]|nr:hypothetical protein [bacterium]
MKRYVWILFYLVLFLLILAFCFSAEIFDFDLWARLIAGMGVIDGHQVLKSDFLSYTPTHVWYDHEWGSGVVFYFLLKYFGPYSLIFLQSILIFGIFVFIVKFVKLRSEKPYEILFYVFALYALLGNFIQPVRCHMFSFFLFAMFLYVLELARHGKKRMLYTLPIFVILWNNLHGGVVSGIGLIFMYALGTFLNDRHNKIWIKYLIIGAVSSIALIINPWGIDYIKFLLMANTMQRADITEWWPLFSKFHLFGFIPFKIFMVTILGIEAGCIYKNIKENGWKNLDKVKLIVLVVTLYLAFSHIKLIPFFVISAAAFCYNDVCNLISRIKMPQYKNKLIYGVLIIVGILPFLIKNISLPLSIEGVYPVREVEFIKINNLKGNLLANFGIGSYLSYKLYPQNKIFMDGRYEEVYPDEYIELLKNFHLVKPGWDEILEKYPPDIILVEKTYPVFYALKKYKGWYLIFEGDRYGVFIRTSDIKKSYIIPVKDLNYYKNTLFDTDIKL